MGTGAIRSADIAVPTQARAIIADPACRLLMRCVPVGLHALMALCVQLQHDPELASHGLHGPRCRDSIVVSAGRRRWRRVCVAFACGPLTIVAAAQFLYASTQPETDKQLSALQQALGALESNTGDLEATKEMFLMRLSVSSDAIDAPS